MSRNVIIAVLVSLLLHAGVAFSGYLFPEEVEVAALESETPTIELELPPPPEPEEQEVMENTVSDAPAEVAELAPPMQADMPTASLDADFTQRPQPPPPLGLSRSTGEIKLPVGPPRSAVGSGLKNLFNLADLDKNPVPTVQGRPVYPFDLKRAGIEGQVLVRFIVDSSGNVRDPEIVRSSHPGFEDAVINAVLKWKFRPGQKGGVAVNTRNVQILLPFSLKSES